jgi:signal transduction histidine kinase/CheY-like chemotaxis protein
MEGTGGALSADDGTVSNQDAASGSFEDSTWSSNKDEMSDAGFALVRSVWLVRLLDRRFRVAGDSHTVRMRKITGFACCMMLGQMATTVWLFFILASGTFTAAIMPVIYSAGSLALSGYYWNSRGAHHDLLVHIHLIFIALLPALMHVQHAGFEWSGHQIHFVFMSPAFASVVYQGQGKIVGRYMGLSTFMVLLCTTLTEYGFVPADSWLFGAARPISHVASTISYQFSLIAPPLGLAVVLYYYSKTMEMLETSRGIALQNAKDALVRAEDEKRANMAKTRFVSVMSHEIRNPLTGIVLNAELLNGTNLDPHQQDYCLGIERASQILLSIVNNVLDVTKIESGSVTLEKVPFNLREATEFVCHTAAPAAFAKGLEVVLECDARAPVYVLGDPTRYRQVIHNLIGNALKFTRHGQIVVKVELVKGQNPYAPDGAGVGRTGTASGAETSGEGGLTFGAGTTSTGASSSSVAASRARRRAKAGKGSVSADEDSSAETSATFETAGSTAQRWRVSVRDSGIGIGPDGRRKLFREFSQVDESTTREYGGTGLGLFICRQLVNLMGGQIGVKSQPGVGSDFSFTMRLERDTAYDTDEPIVALEASDVSWYVVLAVPNLELSRALTNMLEYFFNSCSVRIQPCTTARAAIRLLDEEASRRTKSHSDAAATRRANIVVVDRDISTAALDERVMAEAGTFPVLLVADSSAVEREAISRAGWRYLVAKPPRLSQVCTIMASVCSDAAESSEVRGRRGDPSVVGSTGTLTRGTRAPTYEPGPVAADAPIVMLVDDMDLVRNLVRSVVERLGYRTMVAINGKEAVEAYESAWQRESERLSDRERAREPSMRIALILMDIEMPVKDGRTAAREIREWEKRREVPEVAICAMTANAMRDDVQLCVEAGMNDFMSKPVSQNKLRDVLHRHAPITAVPSTSLDTEHAQPVNAEVAESLQVSGKTPPGEGKTPPGEEAGLGGSPARGSSSLSKATSASRRRKAKKAEKKKAEKAEKAEGE